MTAKKATPEQIRKISEWQRESTRQYTIRLNREKEADLIEHLEQNKPVQGYIKELIRQDMNK